MIIKWSWKYIHQSDIGYVALVVMINDMAHFYYVDVGNIDFGEKHLPLAYAYYE